MDGTVAIHFRVPDVNDDVRVQGSTSAQITLNGVAVVKTLEIGGGQLTVFGSGQLTITGQFILSSERIDVYGKLTVAHFVWSGRYLYGQPSASSSVSNNFGQITAVNSFIVRKGTNGYKQFNDIDIIVHKNLTVDPAIASSGSLTCANCKLTNTNGSTCLLPGLDLYVSSTSNQRLADRDGFRHGLVNYGDIVVALERSASWRWDFKNNGNMTFVSIYFSNVYSVSLADGMLLNSGIVTSYMINFYFNNGYQIQSGSGSVVVYGRPGVYSTDYSKIPGFRTPGKYKDYINNLYNNDTYNPRIWDLSSTVAVQFQSYSYRDVTVNHLTTYGKVHLTFSSWSHSRFLVNGSLQLSPESYVVMGNSQSSSIYVNNTVLVSVSVSKVAGFGDVAIWSGYKLSVLSDCDMATFGHMSVGGGVANISCPTYFNRDVVIGPNGQLTLQSKNVTVKNSMAVSGPVSLSDSKVTVFGRWVWKQSRIQGKQSQVAIRGGGLISGGLGKTLDGVDLTIGSPERSCPEKGVIAEYFQYRVSTPYTPVISSISSYYYPGGRTSNGVLPQEFDNVTSVPTLSRVEPGLSRTPLWNGGAPLVYNDDNPTVVNNSSPLTFSYNYAVRFLTYIHIAQSGLYKLFLITGQGRVRVWVNDQIHFSGRSYTQFMEEQSTPSIQLSAGYHKLRLDYYQLSSSWNTRNSILYVLFEGPGIPKQTLPDSGLFYCITNTTTGLTLYASPRNPRSSSYFSINGEGLILSRGNTSVTIEQKGQLDFLSNAVWYSSGHSAATSVQFYNYGILSKTGVLGSATVCGQYTGKGGQLTQTKGNIDFKTPTSSGCGLVFWINPAGGTWTNQHNWDPPRVPGANDLVYITLSGSPVVVISGSVVARASSLILGGSGSNAQLRVDFLGKLYVEDRLYVYSSKMTVEGTVDASRFTWSGTTIESGLSLSSGLGLINVRESLDLLKGTSTQKFLNKVHVVNRGNMTVDQSLSSSGIVTCTSCKVTNVGYMLTVPLQLSVGSQTAQLINNGTLAVDMRTRSNSWYWDLTNNGRVVIYCAYCLQGSTYTLTLYGTVTNYGTLTSYMTSVNAYGSTTQLNRMGDVIVYGIPGWRSGTQNPSLQGYGNWSEHITELYRPVIVWDVRYQVNLYVRVRSSAGYRFGSLKTYGRVGVSFIYSTSSSDSASVFVSQRLVLGKESTLSTEPTGTSPVIAFGHSAEVSLDRARIRGNWILNVTGSSLSVLRHMSLESGGQLVSSCSGTPLKFGGSFSVQNGSTFSVCDRDVNVSQNLSVAGVLAITNGTARLSGMLDWTDGTVRGNGGRLSLMNGGSVSSDFVKTLDGVVISLEATTQSSSVSYGGVIAEYFQYRIDTPWTERISPIYGYFYPGSSTSNGYLPEEFDDIRSKPNVVRLEPSLSRNPTVYGNGPLKYLKEGYGIDTSSADSFTYNYAVRYLTFLWLPTAGRYRFFFTTGQGRVRLWINDKIIFTGASYSSFLEEQATPYYNLNAGYSKLRVDIIVRSSYWDSYGSMLLVKYEGPGIAKGELSSENVTYAFQNGSSLVYVSRHWSNSPLSSVLSFKGEGLVIARGGAVVNVTNTGVLAIQSDILFYSHVSLGATARIINSGIINKTGDAGIATFYAVYERRGGQVIETMGTVEFLDAETEGNISLWNNPAGGDALDSSNWIPPRIPREDDIVYITLSGSYKVIISSPIPIVLGSLIIGASNSKPDILIEHLTSLEVKYRLDIGTDRIELQGSIVTDSLTWSGRIMVGSAGLGKAKITAKRSFVVFRGDYSSKTLNQIDIVNMGNMTIDQTMTSGSVYCTDCRLINSRRAEIHSYGCNLYGSSGSSTSSNEDDGFVYGLENYGTYAQVWSSTSSSRRFEWHVRNLGRFLLLNTFFSSSTSITMKEVVVNNGSMELYMVALRLNSIIMPPSNGSWSIYSTPGRQYGLPYPSWQSGGYGSRFNYNKFIRDAYQNGTLEIYKDASLWKCCSVPVSFSSIGSSSGVIRFSSLSTYGWVELTLPSGSSGVRVVFTNRLEMSENSFFKADGSTSTLNNTVTFSNGTSIQLGRQSYVSHGWSLVVKENSTLTVLGDLSAVGSSVVNISEGSVLTINGKLTVQDTAQLNVNSRALVVKDSVYVGSKVNLTNSSLTLEEQLRWDRGEVFGASGYVYATGGVDIYGQHSKTLNAVTLSLQGGTFGSSSGVIAEYFQYRVQTDSTARISSLYSYFSGCSSCSGTVPQNFDDLSTVANLARIESSLSRRPRRFGHGPLVYDSSGKTYDFSSPRTFSYNYVVRFSSFLRIWYNDTYRFYFLTGQGRVRIWVDGVVRFTSNSYTSYLQEQQTLVYLSEGYHLLRVDNIQTSSGWDFERNILVVSYSSSCVPKQSLTTRNLYYKIRVNGSDLYAAPAFRIFNEPSVCNVSDTLTGLRSYDVGVSYGSVRDSGLFLPVNGATISIEKTGVLDIQSDNNWPYDSSQGNKTYLRVAGAVGKSTGSAAVKLNCVYNDMGGCRKYEKGSVDLGTFGGKSQITGMKLICSNVTQTNSPQ